MSPSLRGVHIPELWVCSACKEGSGCIIRGTAEYFHQPPQDHEAERLRLYGKLEDLLSQPDLFDESATQDDFVDTV